MKKRQIFLFTAWQLAGLICLFSFLSPLSAGCDPSGAGACPPPDQVLLKNIYPGDETLKYNIYWLGIKVGVLVMRIEQLKACPDRIAITVDVRAANIFVILHPVKDHFETIVSGAWRLPIRYLFCQNEGNRKNRKLTLYDQKNLNVTYTKNDKKPITYKIDGPVHNEYSSFLITRALPLEVGKKAAISVFADKKSHKIQIVTQKKETLSTIFGKVPVIKIKPMLTFKGLYDKKGKPVIWITDDEFRVPVKIKAKITIGSLTAELIEYSRNAL
ncbi:MAG: DUF3108 domain-containing protein [Thermodesulfobacteriota bacterium]|nr:DUF3108 domain-containing protein [Thermodesulfobacteriota bacterium]